MKKEMCNLVRVGDGNSVICTHNSIIISIIIIN